MTTIISFMLLMQFQARCTLKDISVNVAGGFSDACSVYSEQPTVLSPQGLSAHVVVLQMV